MRVHRAHIREARRCSTEVITGTCERLGPRPRPHPRSGGGGDGSGGRSLFGAEGPGEADGRPRRSMPAHRPADAGPEGTIDDRPAGPPRAPAEFAAGRRGPSRPPENRCPGSAELLVTIEIRARGEGCRRRCVIIDLAPGAGPTGARRRSGAVAAGRRRVTPRRGRRASGFTAPGPTPPSPSSARATRRRGRAARDPDGRAGPGPGAPAPPWRQAARDGRRPTFTVASQRDDRRSPARRLLLAALPRRGRSVTAAELIAAARAAHCPRRAASPPSTERPPGHSRGDPAPDHRSARDGHSDNSVRT